MKTSDEAHAIEEAFAAERSRNIFGFDHCQECGAVLDEGQDHKTGCPFVGLTFPQREAFLVLTDPEMKDQPALRKNAAGVLSRAGFCTTTASTYRWTERGRAVLNGLAQRQPGLFP